MTRRDKVDIALACVLGGAILLLSVRPSQGDPGATGDDYVRLFWRAKEAAETSTPCRQPHASERMEVRLVEGRVVCTYYVNPFGYGGASRLVAESIGHRERTAP